MRDARNAQAFVTWAKAETGWTVEVISGLEEGRLIHRGVMTHEPGAEGRVILVDVGGGSCEITLSENKRIKETVSLPLGAVRLTQEFIPMDPPSEEGLARMKQFIQRELRQAHRRIHPGTSAGAVPLVIGTSGTAAALVEAHPALVKSEAKSEGKLEARFESKPEPRSSAKTATNTKSRLRVERIGPDTDGKADAVHEEQPANSSTSAPKPAYEPVAGYATYHQVRRLATKLRKMTMAERSAVPGIGLRRAEIIVAGAFVYAELLESFGLEGFRYSDLGLRDGILAQMLAEKDELATVHAQFEQERWESVLATARRYGVNLSQAEPIRNHAVQLFRDLAPLHKLPAEYQNWLAAAATLSEVGKFINHQGHHRHTQYIISSSEIYGYTLLQRTILSAIARYLGKTRPQPSDRAMRNLPPEEHDNVRKSVVLLRLARALNQDKASDVVRVTARVYPKRILMELEPGKTGAELELWSLRKEADYFREVFGRELFVTLV
jgi:exopolyphosphatase/guanosine-5'-triphosphate,3'-diphosphate pyrophosphatase